MTQQRSYYRIPFPVEQRPRLLAGEAEFEVLDLSEQGAKIATQGDTPRSWDCPFEATVVFHDRETVTATAILERDEDGHAILRFTHNLPLTRIAAEQRRLLALYGRDALRPPAGANEPAR